MVWRRVLIVGIVGAVVATLVYVWALRLGWCLEPILNP
jgi:steroid 5-alpha reductase family enzyme